MNSQEPNAKNAAQENNLTSRLGRCSTSFVIYGMDLVLGVGSGALDSIVQPKIPAGPVFVTSGIAWDLYTGKKSGLTATQNVAAAATLSAFFLAGYAASRTFFDYIKQ